MNTASDAQLLRNYAEDKSEASFTDLTRRHLDFVYSAALRMVRDPHLAEDVSQSVFVALARNASQLMQHPTLSGWLHRTTRNIAAQTVRAEVRRRARENEATMMQELAVTGSEHDWQTIAPMLDQALGQLSEQDRDALFLRYFERKSAREIALALGTSEEAAQKRVGRAIERLRGLFAKRGVAATATGLVAAITANGVHAAPAGLAGKIAISVALAPVIAQTVGTITATKTIAMTTLQKTLIAGSLAITVGTAIYEARQASDLRTETKTLRQMATVNLEKIEQLKLERDRATTAQATSQQEMDRLQKLVADVPRMRGELALLKSAQKTGPGTQTEKPAVDPNDLAMQRFLAAKAQADQIALYLRQMPDKVIPEIQLMTDVDWLTATKEARFDTEENIRRTLSTVRSLAKNRLPLGRSLAAFTKANDGQLPTDVAQLAPFLKAAMGDKPMEDQTITAILDRYKLLHTGSVNDLAPNQWILVEKSPVDKAYDSRAKFGNGQSTTIATGIGNAAIQMMRAINHH